MTMNCEKLRKDYEHNAIEYKKFEKQVEEHMSKLNAQKKELSSCNTKMKELENTMQKVKSNFSSAQQKLATKYQEMQKAKCKNMPQKPSTLSKPSFNIPDDDDLSSDDLSTDSGDEDGMFTL